MRFNKVGVYDKSFGLTKLDSVVAPAGSARVLTYLPRTAAALKEAAATPSREQLKGNPMVRLEHVLELVKLRGT